MPLNPDELNRTIVSYLGVNEPKTASCLILRKSLLDEEFDNLLSNADSSTASPHENCTLILGWNASLFQGVDDAGKDHSTGPLNVIVEAGVLMLVSLQCWERVLKVLKLNNDTKLFSNPRRDSQPRFTHPGQTSFKAIINSSRNSASSRAEILRVRLPM